MQPIAMLLTQEYEDSEAEVPLEELKKAGYEVEILSPRAGDELTGKQGKTTLRSDVAIQAADPTRYSMLLIPGGHSPENLRLEPGVIDFIRTFAACGKPIAAICHGPQLLISAELVRGKKMTCYESVAVDLRNAGALYEDAPIMVDWPYITSRKPDDLPQFCQAMLQALHGQKVATG